MTKAKELSELASAATVTSGNVALSGGLDVDGVTNLDVVDIDGAVDMALTLAVGGAVTANAGVVVDTMTLDAATLTATGSLTIDATGDINLDADGADVNLLDAGTTYAHLSNVSGDFYVTTPTQDKDILIRGNDGGSFITALKFDMSDEGAAIFNSTIKLGTNRGIYIGGTSAANYLEDYETGSATLTWSGTGGSANTSSTTWNYVKIGSLVTVTGNTSSALPNATGTIVLTGLPFACNRNAAGSILYRQLNPPSGMHTMVAFAQSGTTQLMPFWSGSNAYVQLNSSDFNANGAQDMYMTVSYYTTS